MKRNAMLLLKFCSKRTAIVLFCLCNIVIASAQWSTINNGASWVDNNGNDVRAHGYGIIRHGNKWYMVGEDERGKTGANLYSSDDLVNWVFENKIISEKTHPGLGDGSYFTARPHLLYNEKTQKFVVWAHWETPDFKPSEAAVFICDSINGDYKLVKTFRPLNFMVRDDNLFQDDDGTAYFICTTRGNADVAIFKLTDDYLDVEEHVVTLWPDQYREGPTLFKKDGLYYMLTSQCTGWAPNIGQYATAKSLKGPWSNRIQFGGQKTLDTQMTCVLPVSGEVNTTYVYCGDRWSDPGLVESKQILLPLKFEGENLFLDYYDSWKLNRETGEWVENTQTNRVPKENWRIKYASSIGGDDYIAENVFDGNTATIWKTEEGKNQPHELQIDLGKEYEFNGLLCTPRQDGPINGIIRNFLFYASIDGVNWNVPVAGGWMTWQSVISFETVKARYIKLITYSDFTEKTNTITTLAELDLITNAEFRPSTVTPRIKIGNNEWSSDFSTVLDGNESVKIGVKSTGLGSYCIVGPKGYVSFGKENILSNIDIKSSGTYMFMTLNQYNSFSCALQNIKIVDNNEIEKDKLDIAIKRARAVYYNKMLCGTELYSLINEATRIKLSSSSSKEELISVKERLEQEMDLYIRNNIEASEDVTYLLGTASNFTDLSPMGWPSNVLTGTGDGVAEIRNKSFDFRQNLDNIKPGYYLLGVQSFYRSGDNDGGESYRIANENINAQLCLGSKKIELRSLYEEKYDGEGGFNGYCNTVYDVATTFSNDTTKYSNWVSSYISSPEVLIGIINETSKFNDWCCFNNFKLYYLGLTPTSINVPEYNATTNDKVYNLNGVYLGLWSEVKTKLKRGIYIVNGQKIIL